MGGTAGLLADLIGVAVFAASGASAGVAKRLDIFGVVFVGVVAALGGGIVRDLLIGARPPYALTHWPYIVVAVGASVLMFWLHPQFSRLRRVVLVLDAAGLGLFTATGTLLAREAGLPVVGAAIIGMVAAIGGGLGRDVFTGEIPIVLRREIYAVASLVGAALALTLQVAAVARPVTVVITAFVVFAVRIVALRRRWAAPTPRTPSDGGGEPPEQDPPIMRPWVALVRRPRAAGGTSRAGGPVQPRGDMP